MHVCKMETLRQVHVNITLDMKQAGKRSAGNPHAAFDEAGGWKRAYGETSEALSEETESNG